MFPLDGMFVTIDQFNFYEPRSSEALENVFPHLSGSPIQRPYGNSCPSIFKDSSLLGIYKGPSPTTPLDYTPLVCTLSTQLEILTIEDAPYEHASPPSPISIDKNILPDPIQVNFLFPLSGITTTPVMATLHLPNLTIGLLVWYLKWLTTSMLPKTHLVLQPVDMTQGHKIPLTDLPLLPTPRIGGTVATTGHTLAYRFKS